MSINASIEKIQSAISHIDITDRKAVVAAAGAIKAELGEPGYEVWHSELGRHVFADHAGDARLVWEHTSGVYDMDAIFAKAVANGWAWGQPRSRGEIAAEYISGFGLAVVPIPPGLKWPTHEKWNEPGGYFTDAAKAHAFFERNPKHGMGAVLGPSELVSLDIDDAESADILLSEIGIDISELRDTCPSIQGRPDRFRILFRAPEGVHLARHAISWPGRDGGKNFTVFELRAGDVQDVLPPSIHPDTKKPYIWLTEPGNQWPELPEVLLAIWQSWDVFKKNADAICPWAPKKPMPVYSKARTRTPCVGDSIIDAYNRQHSINEALERYGYRRQGKRYLSPHSSTKIPGVIVFPDDNKCFIHHASDPLCSDETGRPVGPFDLYCHYEHGGDYKAAVKAFAKQAGLNTTKPSVSIAAAVPAAVDGVVPETGETIPSIDVHSMNPVEFMRWPHMSKKLQPLNTIPNLKHLLDNYSVTVRYDVIRKDLIITHPGQCGSPDNQRSKAVNTIKSLASLNGLAKTETEQFLLSIGDDSRFNPVMDFITSKEWDGVSRFEDLLNTITVREGFDRQLFRLLMRRWLISAVAAAAKPEGFWSKGVLVFQGEQSLGKTSWFRSLLPPGQRDLLKVGAIINPDNKDTVISAVSHWMVELGELDATLRKADISRLKGFISQDVDQFRRPYGRTEEKIQRRSVFFASVNPEYFLVDDTGNVRWWTIPVTSVNHNHGIDQQQLWAEVYSWFKAGEPWWLSADEENRLSKSNDDHQQAHPVDELILSRYNFDSPVRRSLSTTEVLIELGFEKPTKAQLNDATTFMEKRFGEKVKSNGRRVYRVPPLSKPFGEAQQVKAEANKNPPIDPRTHPTR